MKNQPLRKRYLEAISVSSVSLSLSNITRFYYNYVRENTDKVRSQIERSGYYTLKNKVSTGDNSTNTRDIYISAYFVDVGRADDCNRMLQQKYHGEVDIGTTGGFFVPSTNELVVIIRVYDLENIESSVKKDDIRSTIEHELTHAFDHTSKKDRLSKQKSSLGIGGSFLSTCAYLGCADRSEINDLMMSDLFTLGSTSKSIYAISVILYKLFTLTEFNAHQMSDLEKTHRVDMKKSANVAKALKKDIVTDSKLTRNLLDQAVEITPEECPQLWTIVGRVLNYMGYSAGSSPEAVYKFFASRSEKLFDKFYEKKLKNQIKYIISIREKENIKKKLTSCIKNDKMKTGISFWFSPAGKSDSYLCRIRTINDKISLTLNHKIQKIFGNSDAIYKRAVDAYDSGNTTAFEFAVDNLVDIIVQSLERAFNEISYDPVYDITIPQDEDQIRASNKISSRFADLDWD